MVLLAPRLQERGAALCHDVQRETQNVLFNRPCLEMDPEGWKCKAIETTWGVVGNM